MNDTASVAAAEKTTTSASTPAAVSEPAADPPLLPARKSEINAISIGNLPLQGTNEFVRIAISLSLFPEMILHPTTPAALQPKPMHIVKACLPQALQRANPLSRLNAIRGSTPRSSNSVKSGKKIAIGGSMTATTHAVVRYMPESSASVIIFGIRIASNSFRSRASSANNPRDNSSEG